jgi:hypothetical protein
LIYGYNLERVVHVEKFFEAVILLTVALDGVALPPLALTWFSFSKAQWKTFPLG